MDMWYFARICVHVRSWRHFAKKISRTFPNFSQSMLTPMGITFDCKLKWSNHCTLIVSKCKQRLFFLRLLNSIGVKNDILHVFYTSMIESIMLQHKFVVVINE